MVKRLHRLFLLRSFLLLLSLFLIARHLVAMSSVLVTPAQTAEFGLVSLAVPAEECLTGTALAQKSRCKRPSPSEGWSAA
jgi:hypothetical protein